MYVDPFIAGVIATIMAELVLLIGYAVFIGNKKN